MDMEQELIEDLTAELSISDEKFNADILASKIKSAIREMEKVRKYPSYYDDELIETDLYGYYSNIRSLALYDYNIVGAEGQSSSTENSTTRMYVDRNKCFAGVIPLAVV